MGTCPPRHICIQLEPIIACFGGSQDYHIILLFYPALPKLPFEFAVGLYQPRWRVPRGSRNLAVECYCRRGTCSIVQFMTCLIIISFVANNFQVLNQIQKKKKIKGETRNATEGYKNKNDFRSGRGFFFFFFCVNKFKPV